MEKFLAVVRSFTSSSSKVGIPLGHTLSLISWTVTFHAMSALEEVDYFANMSHFCSLLIIGLALLLLYSVVQSFSSSSSKVGIPPMQTCPIVEQSDLLQRVPAL